MVAVFVNDVNSNITDNNNNNGNTKASLIILVSHLRIPDNRDDAVWPGECVVVDDDVVFGQVGIVHQEHQVTCSNLQLFLHTSSNAIYLPSVL